MYSLSKLYIKVYSVFCHFCFLVRPGGIWNGCFSLEEHKSMLCAWVLFRFHTTQANASISASTRKRKNDDEGKKNVTSQKFNDQNDGCARAL